MTELPPSEPAAAPQTPIPEFKREPSGPPLIGLIVIFVLLVVGAGLLTFAFVYGQQDTENRAINGTVAAVLDFTPTAANTRPSSSTPVPTVAAAPTETASNTPAPSATGAPPSATSPAPTATSAPPTAAATTTRRPTIVQPTDTPVPPTDTPAPAPAVGAHGITGALSLCDPNKTSYAAKAMTSIGLIERVCLMETITNHTANAINYSILGVLAQNTGGGPSQFQTSWRGDLIINGNCTGPAGGGGCGGSHTDTGFFIDAPGNYVLTLRICYSAVEACLGSTGDWESLTGGIPIQVISWTPSP